MRIATYGTFRKGQNRAYLLDYLRSRGKSEVMELPGVKMFVVGYVPGVILTGNPNDKIVVELIETESLGKKEEKQLLELFDRIEGVKYGFYKRSSIDTPRGEAIIYAYTGKADLGQCVQITDWAEWRKSDPEVIEEAADRAGDFAIF